MKSQRDKFSLQRKFAYLNCAYMSPMMKKVEKAGKKGIYEKRTPYKIQPDHFFRELDTLRTLFSKLINNPDKNRIVTIPSVSYGMANVANNIKAEKGDNIVLVGEQFPSNVYPWVNFKEKGVEIKLISPGELKEGRGKQWNKDIIDAIDEKTKLVAMAHIHWADGTLFNLVSIRKKSKEMGAYLAIDGTQSVGALPFDIREIQPDALICAAYKCLMGPYGIGLAYYGPAFDNGKPIEENWINRLNSEDFSGLINYEDQYRDQALKYGVGEQSNFILVPMLVAAIKQLLKWEPENIQGYCKELIASVLPVIKDLGCWVEEEEYRANNLFGIRLPEGVDLEHIKTIFKKNRVSVSFRGNAIRVSPSVYNDEVDVRKLIKSFQEALT
jgi:selenocysteine lyase/cysteine desulfurase